MLLVPNDGLLLCVEGTDGSGKGTQTKKLVEAIKNDGYDVVHIEFPQYTSSFFGKEVGKFLDGQYGELDQIHPKMASMLYAADRFEAKTKMEDHMTKGGIVVCDRYVGSNMAYQCSRLPEDQQAEMIDWLFTMEHDVYGMPEPTATFFLDVPVSISKQLVLLKNKRTYTEKDEDIIESKHGLLERVYKQYKTLSNKYGWITINCMMHENIQTLDTLHPVEVIFDRLKAQVNMVIQSKKEALK